MYFFVVLAIAGAVAEPVSIFGVALERPLTIPMCATEPLGNDAVSAKYKRNVRPGVGACWGHDSVNKVGQPMADGTVKILFKSGTDMSPNLWNEMQAQILDGKVQYLEFTTQGLDTQETDVASLAAKLGKPTKIGTINLQNGFGANFSAISAMWRVSPTLKATFQGWIKHRYLKDPGQFSVGTPAGERAFLAQYASPPPVPL